MSLDQCLITDAELKQAQVLARRLKRAANIYIKKWLPNNDLITEVLNRKYVEAHAANQGYMVTFYADGCMSSMRVYGKREDYPKEMMAQGKHIQTHYYRPLTILSTKLCKRAYKRKHPNG